MMQLDIDSALAEVSSKSDQEIEQETASKWAARAVACYQRYVETNDKKMLLRVDSYAHEALEHAALVGDEGATVGALEREIEHRIRMLAVGVKR